MQLNRLIPIAVAILAIHAFGNGLTAEEIDDADLLWLEDTDAPKTKTWIKRSTRYATERLTQDPRYQDVRQGLLETLKSKHRIITGKYTAAGLYYLETNEAFPVGRLLKTGIEAVGTSSEANVMLDFASINTGGRRGWRYGGYPNFLHELDCIPPDHSRCLVPMSPDGRDAIIVKEFEFGSAPPPEDPFVTQSAAITNFGWFDKDRVLILRANDESERLESNTGRYVRLWQRGTNIDHAPIIYDCGEASSRCDMSVFQSGAGAYAFVSVSDVDEAGAPRRRVFLLDPERRDAREFSEASYYGTQILGVSNGRAILLLGASLEQGNQSFPEGSIVAIPLVHRPDQPQKDGIEGIFIGSTRQVVNPFYGTAVSNDAVWLVVMRDVKSTLLLAERGDSGWSVEPIDIPGDGTVSIHGTTDDSVFIQYENFLTPPELWRVTKDRITRKLRALPAQFDASDLTTEQRFAKSADGTKIPYFVVRPKNAAAKPLPTLMTGYGGFGLSQPPLYLNYTIARWLIQKPWLESGGAIVVANIRGGGEYGPAWHRSAIRDRRNKSFEDFIAVAEDITHTGLTTPEQLGVFGTSNGGLLVGAALNMRPDLFGAANIGVALLDMMRYPDLSAGASWIPEYGDPRNDPKIAAFWKRYSPFQNIRRCNKMPPVLVWGSGTDDRVHPGHGRRYAERLRECGGDVEYFETTEGGHFATGTPEQLSSLVAMHAIHFMQELIDEPE